MVLTDADYWHREVANGFCIEAVMFLPEACGISQQSKMAWPGNGMAMNPNCQKSILSLRAAAPSLFIAYEFEVRKSSIWFLK